MISRKKNFTSLALVSAAFALGGCGIWSSPNVSAEAQGVPVSQLVPDADAEKTSPAPQPASVAENARRDSPPPARSAKPATANAGDDAAIKALGEEIEKIQLEKSAIDAELALAVAQRDMELLPLRLEKTELDAARAARATQFAQKFAALEEERARLERELSLSKMRHDAKLREKQVCLATLEADNREVLLEIASVKAKYENPAEIVAKRRELASVAVSAQPKYLKEPFVDGTLYVSDRRIEFDGPVTAESAARVCNQINFFNNKSTEYPIFIVITNSPGGSVSSGYQIQKAMQSSRAPVYVLVKGMAASMAAVIATTAERSYCFANTMILHHQISSQTPRANLTILQESIRESKKWYKIFAEPVAQKMGITLDEFTKQMYEHNSEGNWTEYGENAVKCKWIDQLVDRVEETAVVAVNPDNSAGVSGIAPWRRGEVEKTDNDGRRYVELPPLSNPLDCWWLYDKSGYYRAR